MTDFQDIVQELTELLDGKTDGLICQVTDDSSKVKPALGKVSVWIEPPDYEWPGWWPHEPDITCKLMLVAGTKDTQYQGMRLIHQAMEALYKANLPMRSAVPAGFNLADSGTLAAYEITLNAI